MTLVEIFNRGATMISFAATPYSVQYAGATASFGSSKVDVTSGTISPGQYFLVRLSSGGANGSPLPTPDATGSINMASGGGQSRAHLRHVRRWTGSGCPLAASVADFVGYGTTADCFEGSGRTAAPSNVTAALRKADGCTGYKPQRGGFLRRRPIRVTPLPHVMTATRLPDVTIDNVTIAEGNGGPAVATFTVSLSRPALPGGVTFDIGTQDDTATSSDNDYVG